MKLNAHCEHVSNIQAEVFFFKSCLIGDFKCQYIILTSTKNDSLYFLRKMIVIHSSVETDRIEIYTRRLLIGRNLHQPKKNHGLHKIVMMM